VIEWGKVPWPLWVYVVLTIGPAVVNVLTASVPVAPSIFYVVVVLAWNYFLLRSVRWLWIATIVLLALFTVLDLVTSTGTWYGDLSGLISVALLLLPATRRYFGSEPATVGA
jgi:hypothetical protein